VSKTGLFVCTPTHSSVEEKASEKSKFSATGTLIVPPSDVLSLEAADSSEEVCEEEVCEGVGSTPLSDVAVDALLALPASPAPLSAPLVPHEANERDIPTASKILKNLFFISMTSILKLL
jgi:hypothetical protein